MPAPRAILAIALFCALAVPAFAASDASTFRVATSDSNVDQLCFYLPGSSAPLCDRQVNRTTGATTALPGFVAGVAADLMTIGGKPLVAKIANVEIAIDDYQAAGATNYDAAFAAAIAAAPAAGADLIGRPGVVYNTTAPVSVPRGNITFRCRTPRTCAIQSSSTTGDIVQVNTATVATTITTTSGSATATVASAAGIAVGNQVASTSVPGGTTVTGVSGTTLTLSVAATANASGTAATFANYVFNVGFDGFVLSKSVTATAGCALNIRNASQVNLRNNRFYGAGQQYNHLCLAAVEDVRSDNTLSDNPINTHLALNGVSAAQGTLEGSVTDLIFDKTILIGGHSAATDPNHGLIECADFCNGLLFRTTLAYSYKGYATYFKGTSANASKNFLLFFVDNNFEADTPGLSGGQYFSYYSSVVETHGWMSGNGVPTINWDTGADSLQVSNMQLALSNGSTTVSDVAVAGSDVSLSNDDLVSYTSSQGIGVGLASTADKVSVTGGRIRQLASGIVANGTNQQITVNGPQFASNTTDIGAGVYTSNKASVTAASNSNGPLPTMVLGAVSLGGTATNPGLTVTGPSGGSGIANGFLAYGTAAGGSPIFAAQGVDTNISITFQSKGTGGHAFTTSSGASLLTLYGGALSANTTSVYAEVNNNGGTSLQQWTLGAADSGGTGYRVIRAPN